MKMARVASLKSVPISPEQESALYCVFFCHYEILIYQCCRKGEFCLMTLNTEAKQNSQANNSEI